MLAAVSVVNITIFLQQNARFLLLTVSLDEDIHKA